MKKYLEENKLHASNSLKHDLLHVFTITDTKTGVEMKCVGENTGGNYTPDNEDVTQYYNFHIADNEAKVKEIMYKNGKYKIEAMLRNKPIPKTFVVTAYYCKDRYTTEEKALRERMMDIHSLLKRRCYGMDYTHYSPARVINLHGKEIAVEYFTVDYFGFNDIINYKTDHIRMDTLSMDELNLVVETLLN